MRLDPIRTIAAVSVASVVYIALTSPIEGLAPRWLTAGVGWYPGFFMAVALCFAITPTVSWWRYPLFVAATSIASFGVVLLASVRWYPYTGSMTLLVTSAFGALLFSLLLRWVLEIYFLKWRHMLVLSVCASLATLLAYNLTYLPVPYPFRVPFVLVSYTLLWWWSFVAGLLLMQFKNGIAIQRENRYRRSNKGFNRTPESSGPAKPGESGGGAG